MKRERERERKRMEEVGKVSKLREEKDIRQKERERRGENLTRECE